MTKAEFDALPPGAHRIRIANAFRGIARREAGGRTAVVPRFSHIEGPADPAALAFAETEPENYEYLEETEDMPREPIRPAPDDQQLSRLDLQGMSPKEIDSARREGRLTSLMSGHDRALARQLETAAEVLGIGAEGGAA